MTLDDTATANGFVAYTCEAVARCLVRHADTLADTGGDPRQAHELYAFADDLRKIAGSHRNEGNGADEASRMDEEDRFDMVRHVDHLADKLAHGIASGEGVALVPMLRMVIRAMGVEEYERPHPATSSEVPF